MLSYYVISVILGFLSLCIGGDRLVITQGEHHTARQGDYLTLKCSLEVKSRGQVGGTPSSAPQWKLHKGRTISTDSGDRMYVVSDGGRSASLHFKNTEIYDAGTYTCYVKSPRYIKADVQLRLADENEEILSISHEMGSTAYLSCAVVQHTTSNTVAWFFNNKRMESIRFNRHYEYKHNDLVIKNVTLDDKGSYRCEVVIKGRTVSVKNINMQVVLSPTIKPMPKTINVISQESVTLICDAVGYPTPTIAWSKEKKLSEFLKLKVPIEGANTSQYHIHKMDQSFEGKYYCKVENMLGMAVEYSELNMQIKPKVDTMKIKVTEEGKSVLMKCTTFGIPAPTMSWYRNNTRISSKEENSRVYSINYSESESRMFIGDVTRSDAGYYTCLGKSVAGLDRKQAKLIVEYKPGVNITTETIVSWPGQKPILRCLADGLPLSVTSVKWSMGASKWLTNSADYVISSRKAGRLVISTLQINLKEGRSHLFGRYSCSVKNRLGSATDTINIIQDNVPGILSNLRVDKESSTSVTLTVDLKKMALKLTGFRVKIVKVSEDNKHDEEDTKTIYFNPDEPMVVDDLSPSTSYIMMVAARNHAGYGKETKFKVRTLSQDLSGYLSDMPASKRSLENGDGRARVGVSKERGVARGSGGVGGGGGGFDLIYGLQRRRAAMILGGAVGMVLVVSLVAVVCKSRTSARKRRQDDYSNSVRCVLGDDMEVMRDLERTTAVDDDLPTATPRTRAKLMHENYATSPRTLRNGKCRPEADGSATTSRSVGGAYDEVTTPIDAPPPRWAYSTFERRAAAGTSNAYQHTPHSTLQHRSVSAESLPPPPQEHAHLTGDATSYHDVLDGYNSADNLT